MTGYRITDCSSEIVIRHTLIQIPGWDEISTPRSSHCLSVHISPLSTDIMKSQPQPSDPVYICFVSVLLLQPPSPEQLSHQQNVHRGEDGFLHPIVRLKTSNSGNPAPHNKAPLQQALQINFIYKEEEERASIDAVSLKSVVKLSTSRPRSHIFEDVKCKQTRTDAHKPSVPSLIIAS